MRKLLLPLLKMASRSNVLVADSAGSWQSTGENFFLPRFNFQPTSATEPRIKVGLFAGLNGNDLGAIRGVSEFVSALNAHPAIGRNYGLWLYPLCDPVGYVNQTVASDFGSNRTTSHGPDPDCSAARLIEKEICERRFDGVILLRGDSQAARIQVRLSGEEVDFVTPALLIAEQALPPTHRAAFAGFSVDKTCQQEAIFAPGPGDQRFQITVEIPRQIPPALQGQLFLVSLHAILAAYRRLCSEAARQLLAQ